MILLRITQTRGVESYYATLKCHNYTSQTYDKLKGSVNEIMATGVKYKDGVHVACAIYAGADYLLTTDMRLLKYHTDKIKLLNPIDFIAEMEV